MSFRDIVNSGKFVVTAEAGPPKGTDVTELREIAQIYKGLVDAVNMTDNQAAVMRMGSLAGSKILLDEGVVPIYQLTCRDRNRLAIQSDLLSAWGLGLENVLALTGDYTTAGDHPQAKPVFDIESVQLVKVIKELNAGKDMAGNTLEGKTDFYVGAVVNPEANPIEPQLMKFDKKVLAGAEFFQTQCVFDIEKYEKFSQHAKKFPQAKILAGILLLKSAGAAKFIRKNVPGIFVPDQIVAELETSSDQLKTGIEIAARTIREIHERKLADGVHIMAIKGEKLVPDIMKAAGLT